MFEDDYGMGVPITTGQAANVPLVESWINQFRPGSRTKLAAEQRSNDYVRGELKEYSFPRRIISPIVLQDGETDISINTDMPVKIVEKEPLSYAGSASFRGTGDRQWVQGSKVECRMGMLTTPRYRKNKYELSTYRNDPKKLLTDNGVKDLGAQESIRLIELADSACALNPSGQIVSHTSALSKHGIIDSLKKQVSRKRMAGAFLMCVELALEIGYATEDEIGQNLLDEIMRNGVAESEKLKPLGVRTILTISNDIVDPNTLYLFAPEEALGRFYLLEDTTMHIQMEGPEVEWFLYEAGGITVIESQAITKTVFNTAIP